MEKRHRSPEEILDAIENQELAEEVDRFAKMSDRDIDRQLADAGVDPESVRAAAPDVLDRAMRKRAEALARTSGAPTEMEGASSGEAPESRVIGIARRSFQGPVRRLTVGWIAAAAVAATTGLFAATQAPNLIAWVNTGRWGSEPTGVLAPRRGERDRADSLRKEAAAACARALWKACAAKLDDARDLDPDRESTPEMKAMRQAIEGANASQAGGAARLGTNDAAR